MDPCQVGHLSARPAPRLLDGLGHLGVGTLGTLGFGASTRPLSGGVRMGVVIAGEGRGPSPRRGAQLTCLNLERQQASLLKPLKWISWILHEKIWRDQRDPTVLVPSELCALSMTAPCMPCIRQIHAALHSGLLEVRVVAESAASLSSLKRTSAVFCRSRTTLGGWCHLAHRCLYVALQVKQSG